MEINRGEGGERAFKVNAFLFHNSPFEFPKCAFLLKAGLSSIL